MWATNRGAGGTSISAKLQLESGYAASSLLLWVPTAVRLALRLDLRSAEFNHPLGRLRGVTSRAFGVTGIPTLLTAIASTNYGHLNDIERHWVVLLPYLGSGLVTYVRISDLDGFGPSHPSGLKLRQRYLGTRLDGRLALQWWPLTRLCSSFGRSGRLVVLHVISLRLQLWASGVVLRWTSCARTRCPLA